MAHRPEKLAALIRDTVALFMREVPQMEFGIVSITEVTVSSDLAYATVYVSALKNAEIVVSMLHKRKKELQKNLNDQLRTYRVPELRFKVDDRSEKAARLDELLRENHKKPGVEDMQEEDA